MTLTIDSPTETISAAELLNLPSSWRLEKELAGTYQQLKETCRNPDKDKENLCTTQGINYLVHELVEWSRRVKPVLPDLINFNGINYNPQTICKQSYDSLLELARSNAQRESYRMMMVRLKEMSLFGRLGNLSASKIRNDILTILKLGPWNKKEVEENNKPLGISENAVPKIKKTDLVPDGIQTIKVIPQDEGGIDYYFNFGPFLSYELKDQRTHLGIGGYGELLVTISSQYNLVAGAELQLAAKLAYDHPILFSGDLKTVEAISLFPILEAGYQGEEYVLMLQAGASFAYSKLYEAEEERDPYSKNIFDNLRLKLGVKTYLLDKRVKLAGGYQHSPWGDGAYLEVGYRFGK